MFFANDSYIFCKGRGEEANKLVNLLNIFERASCQKINMKNSSTFFSCNTDQFKKQEICNILHFQEVGDNTMYLGLPNIMGRNKSIMFGYLKEHVHDIIAG